MFNVKVDNLRQEIKIAEEFRNKHLEGPEEIKKRYVGRYHRKDRQPNIAVAENHAYEYASVIAPSLMYDPPKVVCTAKNPGAGGGEMSMGMMATGIQLSLNRWAEDADATETLRELLLDFLFTWAAALVVEGNQPGYEGVELAPTRPYLLRIPNRHFFLDPNAMTNSPMANNGPRYMGHMWSADVEDLLGELAVVHDCDGADTIAPVFGSWHDLLECPVDAKLNRMTVGIVWRCPASAVSLVNQFLCLHAKQGVVSLHGQRPCLHHAILKEDSLPARRNRIARHDDLPRRQPHFARENNLILDRLRDGNGMYLTILDPRRISHRLLINLHRIQVDLVTGTQF